MPRTYSLAYLTSAPYSPVDALRLAAKLGYSAIGIRIAPAVPGGAYSPLMERPELVRETQAEIRATGVSIFDVEIVRIGSDFNATAFAPFLDVCAALDARAVLVAGDDPDEKRLAESYASFCAEAAKRQLTADLEFMPWTKIPDCRTALRIVQNSGQSNAGVLVDTLHAARSTTTIADLAAIPRNRQHYAQICDAAAEVPTTVEGLLHTARQARLVPGDGGIALAEMLGALRPDIPISVELPNEEWKARIGIEEWSRRALAGARRVLED